MKNSIVFNKKIETKERNINVYADVTSAVFFHKGMINWILFEVEHNMDDINFQQTPNMLIIL